MLLKCCPEFHASLSGLFMWLVKENLMGNIFGGEGGGVYLSSYVHPSFVIVSKGFFKIFWNFQDFENSYRSLSSDGQNNEHKTFLSQSLHHDRLECKLYT
jgi:hypothetical protein